MKTKDHHLLLSHFHLYVILAKYLGNVNVLICLKWYLKFFLVLILSGVENVQVSQNFCSLGATGGPDGVRVDGKWQNRCLLFFWSTNPKIVRRFFIFWFT